MTDQLQQGDNEIVKIAKEAAKTRDNLDQQQRQGTGGRKKPQHQQGEGKLTLDKSVGYIS